MELLHTSNEIGITITATVGKFQLKSIVALSCIESHCYIAGSNRNKNGLLCNVISGYSLLNVMPCHCECPQISLIPPWGLRGTASNNMTSYSYGFYQLQNRSFQSYLVKYNPLEDYLAVIIIKLNVAQKIEH